MALRRLLVGSYNRLGFGTGKGIYNVTFNADTGEMNLEGVCEDCENPSWLLQNGRCLYAARETPESAGLVCYALNDNGGLERLKTVNIPGALSCHLAMGLEGRWLTMANYGSGSLACFALERDGVVGALKQLIRYEGKGADPQRQEGPHIHSSALSPDGRWLVAADLGADRVMIYQVDAASGELAPSRAMPYWRAPAGLGPRHFAFNAKGNRLYLTGELQSRVLACEFDAERGLIVMRQNLSALPERWNGSNLTADVRLSADECRLYASNRGHNSIAVFAVARDGALEAAGHFSCHGDGPRHFQLTNDGWMLIANQQSGSLTACRLNRENGMAEGDYTSLAIPSAVCVLPLE